MDIPAPLWKPCSLCFQFKVLKDFEYARGKPRHKCRQCRYDAKHLKARERRLDNPELVHQKANARYQIDRQKISDKMKIKRRENPALYREKGKTNYTKHREKILADQKAQRLKNPEKVRAKRKEQYWKDPERYRKETQEYNQEHESEIREKRYTKYWEDPEAARLAGRENYHKNIETARANKLVYVANHREQESVRAAKWYKEHPEQAKANATAADVRRRSRMKDIPTEHIPLEKLAARDTHMCHICHQFVEKKDRSRDHIIPVTAEGTSHTWINVALAHKRCNTSRGKGRLPAQFRLFGQFDLSLIASIDWSATPLDTQHVTWENSNQMELFDD